MRRMRRITFNDGVAFEQSVAVRGETNLGMATGGMTACIECGRMDNQDETVTALCSYCGRYICEKCAMIEGPHHTNDLLAGRDSKFQGAHGGTWVWIT